METFNHSFFGLLIAFLTGIIIGVERQYRQRMAGLRTHVLVTVGAAAFVSVAQSLLGDEGAVRVAAYVVSGIGFLGAGVIMRQDGNIQGLNTSATIWCSGAVGVASGAGLYSTAFFITFLIISINIFLRPLVNFIDRKPVDIHTEITHNINIISGIDNAKKVIDRLRRIMQKRNIQMLDFTINPFGNGEVLIKAVLNVTSLSSNEMEEILAELNNENEVNYAFCSLM